jgi:hypothetical protein
VTAISIEIYMCNQLELGTKGGRERERDLFSEGGGEDQREMFWD